LSSWRRVWFLALTHNFEDVRYGKHPIDLSRRLKSAGKAANGLLASFDAPGGENKDANWNCRRGSESVALSVVLSPKNG